MVVVAEGWEEEKRRKGRKTGKRGEGEWPRWRKRGKC